NPRRQPYIRKAITIIKALKPVASLSTALPVDMERHSLRIKIMFSSRTPYLLWALFSVILLIVGQAIDPYIFGLFVFGAAGISGLLVLIAWFLRTRRIGWALIGAIPSILALILLSTYEWA
ncbi:MAG TPA: hypothetical protein PK090_07870, partial [Smithellaceae bacterium]|nr:hypothetical protein [Smithellaceae bacterium]